MEAPLPARKYAPPVAVASFWRVDSLSLVRAGALVCSSMMYFSEEPSSFGASIFTPAGSPTPIA